MPGFNILMKNATTIHTSFMDHQSASPSSAELVPQTTATASPPIPIPWLDFLETMQPLPESQASSMAEPHGPVAYPYLDALHQEFPVSPAQQPTSNDQTATKTKPQLAQHGIHKRHAIRVRQPNQHGQRAIRAAPIPRHAGQASTEKGESISQRSPERPVRASGTTSSLVQTSRELTPIPHTAAPGAESCFAKGVPGAQGAAHPRPGAPSPGGPSARGDAHAGVLAPADGIRETGRRAGRRVEYGDANARHRRDDASSPRCSFRAALL